MKDTVREMDIKDAILDATGRLLARLGYKKMTIEGLAGEVGIGKGSIYLHFSSKEEIALSHIDRIIEQLKENLNIIAAKNISCEDRLKQMLVERVMFRFDSVQNYSQNLDDLLAQIRPKLLERRKRYFIEEARILARVIEEGKNTGVLAGEDPLESAKTLLSATNSLLPFSLSTSELGKRAAIEKKVRLISDMLLNGLIAR